MEAGATSGIKHIGGGISEYRVDFGPGYRVYLAFNGVKLVVLLGGGTKSRQQEDIAKARPNWSDYNNRIKENAHHGTHT
ncbi:MAG: addiction module killer protein [Anaerolineae bacterium]|nr:addiction module killer protein [Anaerolineae bacterium]